MQRINPDIDIIADIIEAVLKARPNDAFCKSISNQYMERGGLSKKQLEGLQGKAARVDGIPPGKLATLEAIIKKKHVTHRSEATVTAIVKTNDEEAGKMIEEILEKYPQHKRVLFFSSNYKKDGELVLNDKEELIRFYKLLITAKQ
ncbi:MAG: hypothetical protein LH615_06905 [Ferruginibacter sp.]|nr:hypothetical protein [Ferruginibacter sp.]